MSRSQTEDAAVALHDVDEAEVGELARRELGDVGQRLLVVERPGERAPDLGEELLASLPSLSLADVANDRASAERASALRLADDEDRVGHGDECVRTPVAEVGLAAPRAALPHGFVDDVHVEVPEMRRKVVDAARVLDAAIVGQLDQAATRRVEVGELAAGVRHPDEVARGVHEGLEQEALLGDPLELLVGVACELQGARGLFGRSPQPALERAHAEAQRDEDRARDDVPGIADGERSLGREEGPPHEHRRDERGPHAGCCSADPRGDRHGERERDPRERAEHRPDEPLHGERGERGERRERGPHDGAAP
jgi:hypothetical protein